MKPKASQDPNAASWNPRVLAWLDFAGLPIDAITRRSGDDVPVVTTAQGERNVWTVLVMSWINARWAEWARELGFHGADAHRKALLSGHTEAEFDAWLVAWVAKTTDRWGPTADRSVATPSGD